MTFSDKNSSRTMNIAFKPRTIIMVIIVSMCANYYYLIDRETEKIFSYLAFGVTLLWGLIIWMELSKLPNIKFSYTVLFLAFPGIALLSAVQANRLYGQSIYMGLSALHFQILWSVLYYILSKYVYYGKITVEDIKKIIKIVGTIQLAIFIGQYFLADVIQVTFVKSAMRYGEHRYYYSCVLLDLLLFMEFDNFTKKANSTHLTAKLSSVVYMAAILFEVMVVQKYRLTSIGLIICIGIGTLILKASFKKKSMYLLLAMLVGLFLLNTQLVQDVLSEILRGQTYNGGISTMDIREIERVYYLDIILKHPILGGGCPNMNFAAARIFSGRDSSFYLSDVGLFGLLFVLGGIGMIWIIALWAKMLRYGWKIYKKKGTLTYLLYPLFFIITGINEAHWFWDDGVMVLVIFLVIQQNEFRSCFIKND